MLGFAVSGGFAQPRRQQILATGETIFALTVTRRKARVELVRSQLVLEWSLLTRILPLAPTAAFSRTPSVPGSTRERVLRAEGGHIWMGEGMSQKGGDRTYEGRPGKDRRRSESRHSFASAKWPSPPLAGFGAGRGTLDSSPSPSRGKCTLCRAERIDPARRPGSP
jgi:hypothetical protein